MRQAGLMGLLALASACSAPTSVQARLPVPASPPADDGRPSNGAQGGTEHAQALEELKLAPLGWATDRQQSLRFLLPDARHWLSVKFSGKKSLVAFRYGKDHHAVVGGFILHVPDTAPQDACGRAFERWTKPWLDIFDVEIVHEPPQAAEWAGKILDIVFGVAIPARGELERARAVRDRFATEVLPKLLITTTVEPKESY
jgi:hypothetical protein